MAFPDLLRYIRLHLTVWGQSPLTVSPGLPQLTQQLPRHRLCLRQISTTKKIKMIQDVIEVIERLARCITAVEQPRLAIDGINYLLEYRQEKSIHRLKTNFILINLLSHTRQPFKLNIDKLTD